MVDMTLEMRESY